MRDASRPLGAIRILRILVGASAAYLLIPTRFDDLSRWPFTAVACLVLLGLGAWVAPVPGAPVKAGRWQALKNSSESLDLNLAALAALALLVKMSFPRVPLAPLAFFVAFPFSVFSSRLRWLWIPGACLAVMALGRYLASKDLLLVPWAAGFALFSLSLVATVRSREKVRMAVAEHEQLEADTAKMKEWIREGSRSQNVHDPKSEKAIAHAAVMEADRLMADLMRWASDVFEARTALLLVPEGPDHYRIRYGGSKPGNLLPNPIPADKGFINFALQQEKTLFINDARAGAGSLAFYAPGVEVGSIAVKVVRRRQPEGAAATGQKPVWYVLYLDKPATDGFERTPELERKQDLFARLVSDTLSVVEDLGRMYDYLVSKDAIAEHARTLTSTLEPERMAEGALGSLHVLHRECEASAFLLGYGPVKVACTRGDAFAGMEGEEVSAKEPSLVGHLLRLVTATGEAAARERVEIVQNNIDKGRKVSLFQTKETVGRVASFAALPCRVKQATGSRLVGVLVVGSSRSGFFSEDLLKDLRTLTDITAPALDNAFTHRERDELSRVDGLTGLLNHRTFQIVLDSKVQRVSREYDTSFAVIMADADHFKRVNDSFGHAVGDEVLRELARRLRTGIRELDTVARYGGEEFVVILDKADWDGARATAEKMRKAVEKAPFDTHAGPLKVTISMGYCVYSLDEGISRQELLERADKALYAAKQAGRNRVIAFCDLNEEPSVKR